MKYFVKNSVEKVLVFIIICFSLSVNAQFHLNGSAFQTNDSCFQLTPASDFVVGSIWNEDKINLNESFQVIMDLNLGCKDGNGADGIVFGFQPISTSIGQAGQGIGFGGVAPSLGIEFDTWQNGDFNDPSFDHIAIFRNGNLNHGSGNTLSGPIQASPNSGNIEDCNFHEMRVNWDAELNELEVFFDCQLRLSYTGDIVNEIFGGDPEVFWGFTAATGGANNIHEVCFSYTTFLDGFEDVVICPGGQLQLNVSGGSSYHWTPATGLSNPDIPNPIAAPDETTIYSVEVFDDCNTPFFDTITVFVDGDTVFFELGVDTLICENFPITLDATSTGQLSVEYDWSTGASTPIISPITSGIYSVTVTIDDYCKADDRILITVVPFPNAALGPDLSACFDEIVHLDATVPNGDAYLWNDGSSNPERDISEAGLYSISVSNFCGESKESILIEFEDCEQVYFPNAFSPNGDGINDLFLPFDEGDVALILTLKIFNRWGGLVYDANDFLPNNFDIAWDGTFLDKDAQQGVYTWFAEVIFRNGVRERYEGSVTLIR